METKEFIRQADIYGALDYLTKRVDSLKETVRTNTLNEIIIPECNVQQDLQNIFDSFLHKIGYDYDQRRW